MKFGTNSNLKISATVIKEKIWRW